jgi:hypothetical protein
MKLLYSLLILALVVTGCKTETEDMGANAAADEAFTKNSETVMANLMGWQNENLDYSMYAEDFVMRETAFSAEQDSTDLKSMMAMDKQMFDRYDFKLLTNPPVLLPGVNPETKMPDGSVRHYSDWEVTLPATDSTEARSGVIKLYESFDFNEEGKIRYQQVYGDFTGLMMHLNGGGMMENKDGM